jgi:Zn finger protein HypA/HybF involved in hydrogenase expression
MKARATLLTVLGIVVIALGLLFLIGAAGQVRRMAIGGFGLAVGAAATGFGLRSYKQADLWSPEQVRADILDSARRKNGELALSDIEARLGRRVRVARPVLEQMQTEGISRQSSKHGSDYFVFPHLQPRLTVRFCQYCDAEFPISEESDSCPNCGGTLDTQVATRSISEGEAFSMDEAPGEVGE